MKKWRLMEINDLPKVDEEVTRLGLSPFYL